VIENEQKLRYPGLRVQREGEAVVVHIPVQFYRRSGRRMIVTEGAQAAKARPQRDTNQTLVEAIAKAYRSQEQIESGDYAGLEDLAKALKLDRSYVGRMLRLTSLAPDIVEAIVRGQEPEGISLRQLHDGVPLCWQEQRARWLKRSISPPIGSLVATDTSPRRQC
jgi:hypothetical protein